MKKNGTLLKIAMSAAFEAGKAIMEIYQSNKFKTEIKEDESPVTKADKASHTIILQQLAKTKLPILSEEGNGELNEERKRWKRIWLVDPLDGTKEFIKKNDEFTINIALIEDEKPVAGVIYAPCLDIMYMGSKETGVFKMEKGTHTVFNPITKRTQFDDLLKKEHVTIIASRSHLSKETRTFINQFKNVELKLLGSALKFMLLLENQADIYPRLAPTMEWDTAAAHAILNAVNRGIYQTDLKTELTYNKPELLNPFFIAF